MSPITDLSDIFHMPRLGKIHLGIKVEREGKNPYPKATDYFVCPPEVRAVYGDQPKELSIMFPVEAPEVFAQQWYRSYTLTQGLVCVGDGIICRRKVDVDTGAVASHDTKEGRWEWKEDLPCDPQECPEYLAKKCRRVMNLQFLLPDVPGLGVWQIDTTSFFSIVNINSMIKMLKGMLDRCSMMPLSLVLGPLEVTPVGLKKKTVYIMHINKDIKLSDMAKLAQLPPGRILLPLPETEDIPEGLFPEEVLEEEAALALTEGAVPAEKKPAASRKKTTPPDVETAVDEGSQLAQGAGGYLEETAEDSSEKLWESMEQGRDTRGEFEKEGRDLTTEAQQEAETEETGQDEAKNLVDQDWLKETLQTLRDKGFSAFNEVKLLNYMESTYKVSGTTVAEAAAVLNTGQAAHFVHNLEESLKRAG